MFHFIGIGGVGMAAVAELLAERGQTVAGSDRAASANTARLEAAGITVYIGHEADNVDSDAIIVVSSAITDQNPELAVARSRGQRVIHRSQALALAASGTDFVAVAGAHGKTTTSGMLAVALVEVGLDPSYAIGSTLPGGASGARLGQGNVFVAEADESDGSFLNYTPAIEIVMNVEPDHLDHYGSVDAFEQAFVDFAELRPEGGLLIGCADDQGARRLLESVGGRRWSYGTDGPASGVEAHISLTITGPSAGSVTFERGHDSFSADLMLAIPGDHMLRNAAAAWAAGIELGVDPTAMADALGMFTGTGRRFEHKGTVRDIQVIDDYAHHPTEVTATLTAAREQTDGRVLVVFQPHLYSRTETFKEAFAKALDLADDVIVTGVFGAREEPVDGIDGHIIAERMVRGEFVADMHEAAEQIVSRAQAGDLIMTMGAGSVTTLTPEILAAL